MSGSERALRKIREGLWWWLGLGLGEGNGVRSEDSPPDPVRVDHFIDLLKFKKCDQEMVRREDRFLKRRQDSKTVCAGV